MKRLLTALLLFIFNGVAAASPAYARSRPLRPLSAGQHVTATAATRTAYRPGRSARFSSRRWGTLQYLLRDSGWSLCSPMRAGAAL